MQKWILFGLFAVTLNANASSKMCSGFLPPNDMYIPVHTGPAALATGITRDQFNGALGRLYNEYRGEVAARGGTLVITRRWTDGTVNAEALQDKGKWYVIMYGGMARHPAINYDGFMAVACHEIGHHLGGAPLYQGEDWPSVEGAADYYAMLKCLRRVFRNDDNEKILAGRRLDRNIVAACEAEHRGRQDQLLCIRGGMAGISLAEVLAALDSGSAPKVTTPDKRRVSQTYEDHPRAQCRLDTYFQAALCRVPVAQSLSKYDYRPGSCADSRSYARGLRPRCWFAP